jgi:hypothetical protein
MKIPEVAFIRHCPNLAPERKIFLEEHIKERVPIKDIRWIEDYNHDHLFVEWINVKLKLPYGLKLTSNMVKNLTIFKQMIDENIEDALLLDDDVTFHADWVKYFESLPDDVRDNQFINLGTSPFFDLKPQMGGVYQLPNNGGCEGWWCTLRFANEFMSNLNVDEALDIVFHGFMKSSNRPLLNLPILHQTSDLEKSSTLDHETRKPSNWVAYVHNYQNLEKFDFNKLIEDFKQFEEKKKKVEEKFYELYGKKVDIKNIKYILNDDQDHRLNILDFKLIEDKMDV